MCATPSASTRLSSVGSLREAFATQKSASFDLVDACTQANLSCDVITYDSDDEMVKSRRGIPFGGLRNKKGHPIYSREDIREQYCITRKELDVLDRTSSAARLFGCLSSHHLPDSHCNKNSFLLLSCVQRRKNSSEFDEESDSGLKSKSGIDEEDSSDGGFKQRLKSTHPITRTVKQTQSNCNCNNNVNFHNNTSDKQLYSRQNTQFYSNYGKERNFRSFDSDYSYETHLNSPLKRPTELQLINNSETSDFNTTTSYSVGQLNDRQSSDGSLWKSSNITSITSDDNRNLSKKHVTFATSHLVRSATVGGINNIHTSPPTQPISERLVNESIQINGTHMMRKTDSMDSFEQMLATSSRMSDILPLYQKAMRRAVMKTQATQTDTTNEKPFHRSNRRTIPDYLTLSPRSTKPESTEELYAEYYESDAEDGEEDILQISLKEKKLRKISKSRVVDKSKQKNRRKLRSISKISPKTQSVDIQTNLEELSFQRLDSSYSESSRLETAIKIEDLSSKSSTDSNQLKSESEMSSTTNEFNSIDSYHSIQSQDSTTVVSELNDSIITNEDKQQLFDEINEVFIVTTDVTKRPLIIDPKKNSLRKSLDSSITSPESDNYSFGTEIKPYLTTELSAQGSDNVDSGGSSVYVSANETSPQIATDKTVSGQTSYETASSGSRYSSPPSMENRGSDRELDYNTQVLDICDNVNTESKSLIISKVDNTSNQLKDYIISTEIIEANDGKDRTLTPDSTISTHYSTEHNIDDFDSEDVGDVTPVQDLSTDTSTAIETQTVIENIIKSSLKPKIPPKPTFLLGDQRINVTKERPILSSNNNTDVVITSDNTTSEECDQQSDDNEEVIDDMSGGDFIVRRNMSGELSTVSEVSEEMSTNGKSYVSDSGSGIQMSFIDKKTPNINNDLNQTDISESGDMHSNTPSIAESTTSGSFMIDGNITEPNSLSENIERPKIEKSGSFPSILNDNNNKSFFMDESVVSDKMIDNVKEEMDENQCKSVNEDKDLREKTIHLLNDDNKEVDKSIVSSEANKHIIQTTIKDENDKQETKNQISENSVRKRRGHLMKAQTECSDLNRPIFTCDEWKSISKRRSRSLSKSPEKPNRLPERSHSCGRSQYLCKQCGEHSVPSLAINKNIIHLQHFKSYSIDTTYHNSLADDEVIGIHVEGYRSSLWLYVARKDELVVWSHKCHKRNTNNKVNRESQEKMVRSDSNESTLSERHFRRHYESVTHRMIHRRASIEMYRKAINNTFEIEKEIIINRSNSEFGFKIHGSRPVVVSAIEKNTPAETCGLDVGDIVVTINGYNVLESSHSDVVKLAHSGTNTLKLEVVSTRSALNCEENDVNNHEIVMSGYLIRFNNDSKTSKTYRNRWFVLKTDNCLYWYKSAKEMDPLGVISLHGYTAGEEQELTGEHPFGFRLVKLRSGVKYFASKDSNTVNQWVLAINQRADILHKCDPYIGLTIKNTSRSATSLTPNDCSGYLAIFSQRRKCWRNRYFVLKDAALYIYFGVDAKSSLGVFLLHGYKVQSCVLIGKKNTFEAIPSESKFRHLWLMAESDIDKKRWLSALEYSIDRWIKL